MINQFYIDYIKTIENPNRVGWNGKVWTAPQYKGYDKNQRGYGIDIVKNDSAKKLTQNRPGQWLTEEEADKLMKEHLLYVYNAALRHIEGFDNLSDRRKAALLGMLYRGDSVNKNRHIININEPDDNKFFESISNYYKSKGLNERARNSSNFFGNNQLQLTNFLIPMKWKLWEPPMKFKNGGQVRKMQTAAGGPITRYETLPNIEVVGYRPIELKTYKPLHKEYPFTGHSSLDIPIDEDTAYTQGQYSPYVISVDKTSLSKDYNLITNNCADATLGALNYIFGTKEKPLLFTTPGDVRDYAINKLHGKVTRDKDGIDTILIPRNKNNAKKISKKALEWAKNKDENTIYEFEYKQGGKMNILEFLKNGSGIHIKEKNKGKFTSYCGGKVTDECILKGKNSSNSAIRKRATFAANARKWKHLDGGIIKAEDGTKTNWWSKIGEGINKGVNSKAGLYIVQGLLLGLGSIFGGNNSSDISNVAKNYNIQQLNAYDELELYKLYSLMKSSVDPENPNANKGVPMQILPGKIRDIEKRMLERQIQLEEINTLLKLDNQKSNLYLDIFSTALGVISNNNSNKNTKNNTSQLNGSPSKTTITSTNNNILKTGYEPYKSGYIDLFGNISTGIGFKFDKNFNVVPFDKSFNYQPLKLNV